MWEGGSALLVNKEELFTSWWWLLAHLGSRTSSQFADEQEAGHKRFYMEVPHALGRERPPLPLRVPGPIFRKTRSLWPRLQLARGFSLSPFRCTWAAVPGTCLCYFFAVPLLARAAACTLMMRGESISHFRTAYCLSRLFCMGQQFPSGEPASSYMRVHEVVPKEG